MKIRDIYEMAIKSGNLRKLADTFASSHKHEWLSYPHIADIDEMQVLRYENHYVLLKDGALIAHFQIDPVPHDNSAAIVDGVWIAEHAAGQKIFSRFLWFLKSREHRSKLIFGDVHSSETYDLLKAGGLSRFKKSWEDNSTGSKIDFDPSTMDEFYTRSKWKLVFECYDDSFDDFPRFTLDENWIKETYEWQIE